MWSRHLFLLGFFTLTILTTQSHVIHKRGLLSKLFGGGIQSNRDGQTDMTTHERSKLAELLKNPFVLTMLTAAVGMVVQKALAARNMHDVCENQYVKMAHMAGNLSPSLQQAINLLGCNGSNRKSDNDQHQDDSSKTSNNGKNQNSEESSDKHNENQNEKGKSKIDITPEKQSEIKQLINAALDDKDSKRNFFTKIFGLGGKNKKLKEDHELPSSTYKLDNEDANSMKNLGKEIDEYAKVFT